MTILNQPGHISRFMAEAADNSDKFDTFFHFATSIKQNKLDKRL